MTVEAPPPRVSEHLAGAYLSDGTALADLVRVEQRQVATRVQSDPEIFELELEKIFNKTWVFVAHETEIPNEGDFVTRYIGRDPVIVTRSDDGGIHVMLNVCTHRGGEVCRADFGNANTFQCGYHGWIFKNTGQLRGVPAQTAFYDQGFDKGKHGLRKARVGVSHGLVFATWSEDAPSLEEHIGETMAFYYDLIFNLTDEGMEVAGPPQRWTVKANWKIASENFSIDNTHPMTLHKFVFALDLLPAADISDAKLTLVSDPQRGHSFMAGIIPPFEGVPEDQALDITFAILGIPEEMKAQVLAHLEDPLKRKAFLRALPSICNLFPNFSVININLPTERGQQPFAIPHLVSIRMWYPKAADEMEIWSWTLVMKGAPEELKRIAALTSLRTFGPAGTFEQDDAWIWSGIQRGIGGLQGRKQINCYLSTMPVADTDLPGTVRFGGTGDDTVLEFYTKWRELMLADGTAAGVSGNSTNGGGN